MSEGARGGGRGSVGTVLVARRAILIESGEGFGLAAKARNDEQPCNPVEHDRRYFTPTTFKRRCTHATPHEGTGSPRIIIPFQVNRLYLAMQVSRPSFSLPAPPAPRRGNRASPLPPYSPPRIAQFSPSPFVLLLTTVLPRLPLNRSYLFIVYSHRCSCARTYTFLSFLFLFLLFFLGLTERWLGGGQGRMFVLEEYELRRIFFFLSRQIGERGIEGFFLSCLFLFLFFNIDRNIVTRQVGILVSFKKFNGGWKVLREAFLDRQEKRELKDFF